MSRAKPMASQLAGYTDDELLEELVRRRNGLAAAEDEKLPWCHDCAHCLVWDGDGDPPRSWTVCGKGHKPRFQAPRDMGEAVHGDYGFFMRVCRDRLLREGCARCTTRAAPHDPPRQHIREAKKSLDSSNTMK